jgi:hypothetical protein
MNRREPQRLLYSFDKFRNDGVIIQNQKKYKKKSPFQRTELREGLFLAQQVLPKPTRIFLAQTTVLPTKTLRRDKASNPRSTKQIRCCSPRELVRWYQISRIMGIKSRSQTSISSTRTLVEA